MIGCGAIARQYLDTARRLDAIEIVAAADRVPARATAVEAAEGIPAMPVADLLANAEVDVVLNLTIPAAHAAIALQAIAAGKASCRKGRGRPRSLSVLIIWQPWLGALPASRRWS